MSNIKVKRSKWMNAILKLHGGSCTVLVIGLQSASYLLVLQFIIVTWIK